MNKLTVYGLPLNPAPLLDTLAGGSFCVSFATRARLGKQLEQAIGLCGQDGILLVDNGAFSMWMKALKEGQDPVVASLATLEEDYLAAFEAWAIDILDRCPQAIAVIPDVIDGTEAQNDDLINWSQLPFERSMPVWHLNESLDRLTGLCAAGFDYVAFGSAGAFGQVGTPAWHARIEEALAAIDSFCSSSNGAYIRPRIHMMRAQSQAHLYGFDSSDSTNVAVNHSRQLRVAGEDVAQFAERIDSRIQASAGPEAAHQVARPLLWHLEASELQRKWDAELGEDLGIPAELAWAA